MSREYFSMGTFLYGERLSFLRVLSVEASTFKYTEGGLWEWFPEMHALCNPFAHVAKPIAHLVLRRWLRRAWCWANVGVDQAAQEAPAANDSQRLPSLPRE
jgi:hypothetical protein